MKPNLSKKEALLRELTSDTYVMLRPSPIAGVGVFALRTIPQGCRNLFSPPDAPDHWVTLTRTEVDTLPAHARALVENYCLYDEEQYYVPETGFKKIDLSLFLNHSDSPNIVSINEGEYFETLREIREGEELVIDYGTIVAE